ncbi:response regulator [Chitinophaga rhizophila]|uniref:Response regulator n=1 Tax=Chitinophaga rhizophila TaxID=2866212 RepID=A0ABS7G7S2_9BACT|nr:response regulator [Chitinophaga rhizophila]MBW8682772.1 response regulator [Chitinophaga rhizophila]
MKSILLIDDDADEISILNEAVAMTGTDSTCNWAKGAEMAFRYLSGNLPDLILLDYNMPGHDGLMCLEELKKNNALSHIPVVMYSTYIDYGLRQEAIDRGAFQCIQKTTSVGDLIKELKLLFLRF